MTYKNLKKYLENNKSTINNKVFDLNACALKSKTLFIVGDNTSNIASFLCSIMKCAGIPHSRYINCDKVELKNRFLRKGKRVPIDELCSSAEGYIKASGKAVDSASLLLLMAMRLLGGEEYRVIELSEKLFANMCSSVPAVGIVFEEKTDLIECIDDPQVMIIAPTDDENMDYISSSENVHGAKITWTSDSKITKFKSDLLGTSFYYYDYLYRIPSIDENNVPRAHLAIEAARTILKLTKAQIYKGLESSFLEDDLQLISISPAIFIYEGERSFSLYHKLDLDIITAEDGIKKPTRDTVFCGDAKFIEKVKNILK